MHVFLSVTRIPTYIRCFILSSLGVGGGLCRWDFYLYPWGGAPVTGTLMYLIEHPRPRFAVSRVCRAGLARVVYNDLVMAYARAQILYHDTCSFPRRFQCLAGLGWVGLCWWVGKLRGHVSSSLSHPSCPCCQAGLLDKPGDRYNSINVVSSTIKGCNQTF